MAWPQHCRRIATTGGDLPRYRTLPMFTRERASLFGRAEFTCIFFHVHASLRSGCEGNDLSHKRRPNFSA